MDKDEKKKKNEYYKRNKNSVLHKEAVDLNSKERKTNLMNMCMNTEKSSKKIIFNKSKAIAGDTNNHCSGMGKEKKTTPLKKNFDKYYFWSLVCPYRPSFVEDGNFWFFVLRICVHDIDLKFKILVYLVKIMKIIIFQSLPSECIFREDKFLNEVFKLILPPYFFYSPIYPQV